MVIDFPKAWNGSLRGVMRVKPDDFQVDEIPSVIPNGEGEHVWLKIRKTSVNTEWVAGELARSAGIAKKQVSYAGMKDRHAVTTQWFSLHMPGQVSPKLSNLSKGIEVLQQTRHSKKLKRGCLKGNRFVITLRDCQGDKDQMDSIVQAIRLKGVPNYFGVQRFGRKGNNIADATTWFAEGKSPCQRHLRSVYLSASRSWIFNHILAQRVEANNWNIATQGDVFILNQTHSFFQEMPNDAIIQRLNNGELHLTGALWGKGELPSRGTIEALEKKVASQFDILAHGLEVNGLEQRRRSLRLIPRYFHTEWMNDTVLKVTMELESGSFATTILEELGRFDL